MIAINFRKFPSAMALQLPLPFGPLLRWATARPTSRVARSIRAARGAAFKLAGRVRQPVKRSTPQWVKVKRAAARSLALHVKALCMGLVYCAP